KSQGSEAETVLLPIWTEPKSKIWNRSLLYTALTRGKDKVILVGKDEAIESAVKNRGGYRSTMLPLLYRNIAKKKAKYLLKSNINRFFNHLTVGFIYFDLYFDKLYVISFLDVK